MYKNFKYINYFIHRIQVILLIQLNISFKGVNFSLLMA